MTRRAAIVLAAALAVSAAQAAPAPEPQVAEGRIESVTTLKFEHIAPRPVRIWLPADYPMSAPYAVLYMHDGQMLFDADITWNHQEWGVDEVAGKLQREQILRPFIVVAIDNAGTGRIGEYFPQRAFNALAPEQRSALLAAYSKAVGQPVAAITSDAYLDFLVHELKPYVDTHYAVSPARADTLLMGSSMGALISLYALGEYPQVFGGAACLSTHWPGQLGETPDNPVPAALLRYVETRLPRADGHRLYFDHGDKTLDASYADRQRKADALLRAKGYTDADFMTRVFPGAEHSETAWRARLDVPLRFLLGKPALHDELGKKRAEEK